VSGWSTIKLALQNLLLISASTNSSNQRGKVIYLLHKDAFIHGPFDFTMMVKGHQSRDIVSVENWRVLHNHCNLYSNDPPSMRMVAQLSIHCTPLFHTQVDSPKVDEKLLTMPLLTQEYYC
jgi:hypothetical protein